MKRLIINVQADLFEQLQALAADERRALSDQVVIILETAVKMHQGKKAAAERRKRVREYYNPGGAK